MTEKDIRRTARRRLVKAAVAVVRAKITAKPSTAWTNYMTRCKNWHKIQHQEVPPCNMTAK